MPPNKTQGPPALSPLGEAGPRLLFVVTEDWYFWSHRLPMARAAQKAGFKVAVATRVNTHGARIVAAGFRLIPLRSLSRQGRSPFGELKAILELVALYRREKPDIVHHVALKPVLYGALAARLANIHPVVNAMAGLGFVFTAQTVKVRLLRLLISTAFRFLLRGSILLVQNSDDRAFFVKTGLIAAHAVHLIPGSGVDIARFSPSREADGPPVALFVGRLLWHKGAGDLIEAARLVRSKGHRLRVWLAGERDPANPACIPADILSAWGEDQDVELLGHRDDIESLWAQAHIAVLPTSYREGIPMALLEAAACGRPLLATDVAGCRDLVRDEENGLLVPAHTVPALARALERLATDPTLRQRLGAAARCDAETLYSEKAVGTAIVALYRSLLDEGTR